MARPSAILELTWDRVDFGRRLIDLNPAGRKQTAKRRPVVKMNDELHAALGRGVEHGPDVAALGQVHPQEVAALRCGEARLRQLLFKRGGQCLRALAQCVLDGGNRAIDGAAAAEVVDDRLRHHAG